MGEGGGNALVGDKWDDLSTCCNDSCILIDFRETVMTPIYTEIISGFDLSVYLIR